MKWKFLSIILLILAMAAQSSSLMGQNNRSLKEKAILIGGSAAAGAALGGMLGGKDGALAGAIAGGSGAAIYDRATNDRDRRNGRSTRNKAILIGGSAAAGAATGAITAGKKGALIGAAIGAAGGYILDKKTRDNGRIF